MKTNATSIGQMNGTSTFMVLGVLFLTTLPISNVVAGGMDEKAVKTEFVTERTEPVLTIENWMLEDINWTIEEIATEDSVMKTLENWMLTPEGWENDWHYDVADFPDSRLNQLDDWMLEPADWSRDLAFLTSYL
jgi:hypothetical protein